MHIAGWLLRATRTLFILVSILAWAFRPTWPKGPRSGTPTQGVGELVVYGVSIVTRLVRAAVWVFGPRSGAAPWS